MDKRSIEKFSDEHIRAIDETDNSIQRWQKFQDDYEALRGRLATLPDKVSYEIMVPFTSLAFMPGRLVHTNELLVLLGDNWFAERSAKEAAEIVDRRLTVVRENLSGLDKQKAMLASRHEFAKSLQAVAADGNEFEIKEEYDEHKERAWREEHRRRVAAAKKAQSPADKSRAGPEAEAHRKAKAERSAASGSCKDDATAFARLAELDLQEHKRHELRSLNSKSAAHSAAAAGADTETAPADTTAAAAADDGDEDDASPADLTAPSSRPLGHTKSKSCDSDRAPKKRVTFFDEMQHRKSSEVSQPGTDSSSEGDSDVGESEAMEKEIEEAEESNEEESNEEESNEEEDAGKEQSSSEDDGDTEFSGDYHAPRPPGSNSCATIFFTHSTQEEVLSMGLADPETCIPTDDAVVSVHSPADVYKLVAGFDQGHLMSLRHSSSHSIAEISKAENTELKSILKRRVDDTDRSVCSTMQEPHAAVYSARMSGKPAPILPESAGVPAFGDHVIEREPSSLLNSGSTTSASENVHGSGPQRPVSKFKAHQQRLHR